MFVWVGINVEEQLKAAREAVDKTFSCMDISNANCKLPLHISLKISFRIPDASFDAVLRDIEEIYNATEPFSIDVKGMETHGNIAWIRMVSNESIERLATELNFMLRDKYGIPLHEYDLDYIFHTTLFMDDKPEKISAAYERVRDIELPNTLRIDRFIIGRSESGENGTYYVYKEIQK